ncbi:RagB/SusD family nutrient uptake outer membrane protein [Chitinophaga pendula]|uniref:RagB/SusD family nutrient uptake outer membrane protein n=1 Tax=Chitinophaga TaxID=79328 RepID=UPI000BAF8DCD|nr:MULTISPECIES: RagB/SusD family nutrient uptake outer membrane protein [Chitinophaga]ASZ13785.1 RagB/SusD family nutrient uptake outer membrane protein [Chitinophaga sp. MD30]UCJ08595.1 RagB/SusD family nutrient uptake outer membrane protein [Chitinophaga pendula]
MKKVTFIIGTIIVLSGLWSSCGKDFLERVPENEIPEVNFWKNDNDAYLALNGIYNSLGKEVIYDDGATDNAHAQYQWESNATFISQGTVTTDVNEGWDYNAIRRANYFLENVDKVNMNDALKARYKAEARFLRAYYYCNLVNKIGDVPLVTKVLTAEGSYVPRDPRATVLNFILTELDECAKVLPERYAGGGTDNGTHTERGRATKGAALALKARMHLYNGQWQQAVDAASAVMAIPGYDLFTVSSESGRDTQDNYAAWVNFTDAAEQRRFRLGLRSYEKLFIAANNNNKEVIFDRQLIKQRDDKSTTTFLLSADMGGWSSVTPTQELVNAYESFKTGLPVVPPSPAERAKRYAARETDPLFYEEYKNRDPRFYASILFDKSPWSNLEANYVFKWIKGGSNRSRTGYNFRKLVDPDAWNERINSYANTMLLRFAEVLLTYAEAKNELSGPDATVYDAIDRIRVRAGMPVLDRAQYGTQDRLRTAIRRERRIELAVEGQRYMDIRRWKIAPDVMKTIMDLENTPAQDRVWNDKLYLMPVPQKERDLNPQLTQNSGY